MSVEMMLLLQVKKVGLSFERLVVEDGRIRYNIAGKYYILRDAANEFLDGGWDSNYHDVAKY